MGFLSLDLYSPPIDDATAIDTLTAHTLTAHTLPSVHTLPPHLAKLLDARNDLGIDLGDGLDVVKVPLGRAWSLHPTRGCGS